MTDPRDLLDPEIAAWIDVAPAPDIDYADVVAVRAMSDAYMAETGGPAPRFSRDGVVLFEAVAGGVPVLVWAPENVARPLPVVIALHGGGFVVGSALGAERLAVPLAAHYGVITVSVEYSLAPEFPAPVAADETWSVIRDLLARRAVAELPLDAARLAVHGSSAGACLAAGAALRCRDEGVALALQSLSCPALDPSAPASPPGGHSMLGWGPTWSRAATAAMWVHYLGDATTHSPYAVPSAAEDLVGVAPAHILLAQYDVLRDEGYAYARRLADAGVDVTVDAPAGTVHGFDGLLPDSAVARRALARQADALAGALGAGRR
ncbi:MAG: alpha/beta hydrolase fold domain-containing protein [bacterium]